MDDNPYDWYELFLRKIGDKIAQAKNTGEKVADGHQDSRLLITDYS